MAPSATSAMRDVFESRRDSLDEALVAFPPVEGQRGFVALLGGKAAGFDLVSRPEAYARLHGKLVRSYVMDGLLERKRRGKEPDAAELPEAARVFLDEAAGCEEKLFKSVGYGEDCRFKGDRIAGSALVEKGTVIHAAFFRIDPEAGADRMSGINRRRAFRV